jgi:hypothetical protein
MGEKTRMLKRWVTSFFFIINHVDIERPLTV